MSHIVAILPVRNEAWCIGLTLRALLMWVDSVALTLHNCTDGTHDIVCRIVEETGGRVFICVEESEAWQEMVQRDRLLKFARSCDATHCVITDADEILSGNLLPRIRQMVESTPRGSVLQLPWVQLKGSIGTYISSGMWSQQCASTAFPDDPAYCWKAQTDGYQHHNRQPMGKPIMPHMPMGRSVKAGGCLHLQMVSDKRLRYKQAHYLMASETLRHPGRKTPAELNAMYGPTVYAPGSVLSPVPPEWWAPYEHLMKYLDVDAEPWQAAECRRLWKEHGPEKFAGLDLFGVDLG